MKNYEEMAQSVLNRRDTEIKRRKKAFLIGAPCAAAVLVGVVGVGAIAIANRPVINTTFAADGSGTMSDSAVASAVVGIDKPESNPEIGIIDIATDPNPYKPDYTNPNSGQNDIHVLKIDTININHSNTILDLNDFNEYKLEALDSFYGLRFNRLAESYPAWKLSHDKLGVYKRETNDGVVASLEMYHTLNTLVYTTENNAKVTVSAQYTKFMPISSEVLTDDKPVSIPEPETHTEYDENGNVIGQAAAGYDPTKNPNKPTPDEGVSTVNGYEALIYRDSNGSFLADLDMSSRVRITAEGLSEEEFLEVLDNFTK